MLEKIRHGAEITSAKLNEIIDAVNDNNNTHEDIKSLAESIKTTIAEVYNTLEKYSEQVGEHLDSIPEIKNLYADILLARDSVDWVDIAEDSTDETALIAANLTGYEGDSEEPAQRLRIVRGNFNQVNLNTPEKIDKQILVAYQTDSDGNIIKGMMYFDYYDAKATAEYVLAHPEDPDHKVIKRVPVTATGDVNITSLAPTLEFETQADGSEVLKMTNPDGSVNRSKDLRGPAGTSGAQGPQGIKGEKGDKGDQGVQGIQGAKGQDGATTLISIMFSNRSTGLYPTETYNNHKYMGIKTYLSTDDEAAAEARPYKWFRISGDTLYPMYNDKTGVLTFTTIKPTEELSFRIQGPQGPTGPEGKTPIIAFKKSDDDDLIELKFISSEGQYVYDASMFTGEKGDKGDKGDIGPKGDKGDKPILKFKADSTTDNQPSVEDTTPIGSQYDAEYTIKIPKGENGLSVFKKDTSADGSTLLYLTKGDPTTDNPTIDRIINLGILKGEKGDKGDPATISIKGAVESTSALPTSNLTSGDAYVVTSIVEGENVSELYICVNPLAESVAEIYKNLGNIKGEKGNAGDDGKDGATWITGTVVTQSGSVSLEAGYKEGDFYLNTSTGILYKIVSANGTTYTVTQVGSLKGPKGEKGETGDTGAIGRGISKIEKTSTVEKTNTFTITYTDNLTSTFTLNDGTDGKNGKNGENGTKIYNGEGTPAEATGNIGDYYIDNNTGMLYKKTDSFIWTYLITLKGSDGTVMYSGTTSPDNSIGNPKDYYLNYTTGQLYEKSKNNVWLYKVHLRGPQISTLKGTTMLESTEGFMLGDLLLLLGTSDLYQVQGTLDLSSWAHVGNLKGIKGAQGDKGDKGDKGEKGDRGDYIPAYKEEFSGTEFTEALQSSHYYILTSTSLTKIAPTLIPVDDNIIGEYIIQFRYNTNLRITLPTGVTYANNWQTSDYVSGDTYVIYIFNNIAYVSYT